MFSNAGVFLISTLFQLYIMVLMLRVVMQLFRANFTNPISQLVIKLTNPVVMPLKPYIPGFKGIDLSVVLVIYVLEVLKLLLIAKLLYGVWFSLPIVALKAIFEMLADFTSFIFYLVLIRIILSWVSPPQAGPLQEICYISTEPVLRPFRRLIPPVSGFDLSPIAAMICLQLAKIVLQSLV